MEKIPSIVLITSCQGRHYLGATMLAKELNILGIVSEARRALQSGKTAEEDAVIKDYDQECAEKEKEYFGRATHFPLGEDRILRIRYGQASSEETTKWIADKNPDYVVLFSVSVLHEPLLSLYEKRIINLHLGLTPYYRGSGNAFWPLALGEPEGLGATVHLVVKELDAGSILGQARPDGVEETDGPRDISNKNVLSGINLLIRCVKGYANGTIVPVPQRTDIGKVFRNKDYSAKAIRALKDHFRSGMMKEYLLHKEERDSRYPIIQR